MAEETKPDPVPLSEERRSPAPSPPPAADYGRQQPVYIQQVPAKRGGFLRRIGMSLLGVALLLSLTANLYLGMIVSVLSGDYRETVLVPGDPSQQIVVIPIDGIINAGAEEFLLPTLRRLEASPPKAVILRVDSPGGDPFASDRMWHALGRFKERTNVPIVASFGGLAASGGYYIAAGSDHIVAEPNCLTGSIGVISIRLNPEGLLTEVLKIEPHVQVATMSPRKDVGNHPFRWEADDQAANQALLDTLDTQFKHVVRSGRSELAADPERFALATSGLAFSAAVARDKGLIDQIGYLDDAIVKARELGGIPPDADAHVVVVRRPIPSVLRSLLGVRQTEQASIPVWPSDGHALREMVLDATSWRPEYRWYPGW